MKEFSTHEIEWQKELPESPTPGSKFWLYGSIPCESQTCMVCGETYPPNQYRIVPGRKNSWFYFDFVLCFDCSSVYFALPFDGELEYAERISQVKRLRRLYKLVGVDPDIYEDIPF